jgi:hypothetical protein
VLPYSSTVHIDAWQLIVVEIDCLISNVRVLHVYRLH